MQYTDRRFSSTDEGAPLGNKRTMLQSARCRSKPPQILKRLSPDQPRFLKGPWNRSTDQSEILRTYVVLRIHSFPLVITFN